MMWFTNHNYSFQKQTGNACDLVNFSMMFSITELLRTFQKPRLNWEKRDLFPMVGLFIPHKQIFTCNEGSRCLRNMRLVRAVLISNNNYMLYDLCHKASKRSKAKILLVHFMLIFFSASNRWDRLDIFF